MPEDSEEATGDTGSEHSPECQQSPDCLVVRCKCKCHDADNEDEGERP